MTLEPIWCLVQQCVTRCTPSQLLISIVVTGYFAAFGNGICYTSPVSALQKRFSIYRGAAAGFAVSGFGIRSMAWAKAYLSMIARTTVPDLLDVIMYSCAFCLHSLLSSFHVNGLNIHGAVVYKTQEESFQRGENVSIMSLVGCAQVSREPDHS
ncbi:unnamed protein product [Peronospora destructor]|uniref:Uncharacterized protein n=1 Tax=Peronospora destructor TaxID=86335 RepID=A0AAV0V7X3_9STRA|nr:unnamed protein product [Peronospora destructor]